MNISSLYLHLYLHGLQPSTVSPFALHQQQLAMLAYQQSLIAAAAKSKAEASYVPGSTQQPGTNGSNSHLLKPNWSQSGIETSGLMAEGSQNDLVRLMQVWLHNCLYWSIFIIVSKHTWQLLEVWFSVMNVGRPKKYKYENTSRYTSSNSCFFEKMFKIHQTYSAPL